MPTHRNDLNFSRITHFSEAALGVWARVWEGGILAGVHPATPAFWARGGEFDFPACSAVVEMGGTCPSLPGESFQRSPRRGSSAPPGKDRACSGTLTWRHRRVLSGCARPTSVPESSTRAAVLGHRDFKQSVTSPSPARGLVRGWCEFRRRLRVTLGLLRAWKSDRGSQEGAAWEPQELTPPHGFPNVFRKRLVDSSQGRRDPGNGLVPESRWPLPLAELRGFSGGDAGSCMLEADKPPSMLRNTDPSQFIPQGQSPEGDRQRKREIRARSLRFLVPKLSETGSDLARRGHYHVRDATWRQQKTPETRTRAVPCPGQRRQRSRLGDTVIPPRVTAAAEMDAFAIDEGDPRSGPQSTPVTPAGPSATHLFPPVTRCRGAASPPQPQQRPQQVRRRMRPRSQAPKPVKVSTFANDVLFDQFDISQKAWLLHTYIPT